MKFRGLFAFGVLTGTAPAAAAPAPAIAAAPALTAVAPPVLVVAVHVRPTDRDALRRAVETGQVAQLQKWRTERLITGFRLLFSRYADSGQWDASELIQFRDEAALTRWRKATNAPVIPEVLAMAQEIETTPGLVNRSEGSRSEHPAVLVIPYEVLVPTAQYVAYLDGYTIPQFRGWIKAGVLDGYDVVMSNYPAGRTWASLITLRYHDDNALGHRDAIVQATRAKLAGDQAWKALADSKKGIRTEHALVVADEIAAEGDVQ